MTSSKALSPTSRLYNLPVPLIGLTGGVASGKTAVASRLKSLGFPLIDADLLVKEIYKLKETRDFVRVNFPSSYIRGNIDFRALRRDVFAHPLKKILLESFIYPHLPKAFLKAYEDLNNPSLVVYDAPLLFERALQDKMDWVVVVYTSRELQRQRLMKRDNLSEGEAELILQSQISLEDKRKLADLVVSNVGSLKTLDEEINKLAVWLRCKA